jgi:hypothetical protein
MKEKEWAMIGRCLVILKRLWGKVRFGGIKSGAPKCQKGAGKGQN